MYNLKYDIFGNISGDLIDTTDYNEGKEEPIIVQKARELQDEDKIEPKFIIILRTQIYAIIYLCLV